jgi:hypothetical protein
MMPERLQEISNPLESLLYKHRFNMDGEPLVEGTIRMASFARKDGIKADYALEVVNDNQKSPQENTDIDLNVRLYKNRFAIPLYDGRPLSTFLAPTVVKYLVKDAVGPQLRKCLNNCPLDRLDYLFHQY